MAEIVADANVLVGLMDEHDALHTRAAELRRRLEDEGHQLVYLDVCIGEAVSVICRRARQRTTAPPDLARFIEEVRS